MTIFDQISIRIIKEQELIIGPVAWTEAGKVPGFHVVDQKKGEVSMDGDPKEVLNNLVAQYARLFGRASNAVCKEAAKDLTAGLSQTEVPASLQ
jgi:hypothetical protein